MTIRAQLFILIVIPLLCAAGAVGGTLYLKRIKALSDQGISQLVPLTNELNDFLQFLQEPPPGPGKPAQYHLQATRNRITNLTLKLKTVVPPPAPQEQQLLNTLNAAPEQLSKHLDQSIRGNAGLSNQGAAVLTREIKTYLPLIDQLNNLYFLMFQSATGMIGQLHMALLLLAAAWPLLLSVLLYRTLARPLNQLQNAMTAIGRGELACRITGQSPGELGHLIVAFNKMAESRQKAETTVKESEGRLKDLFDNLQMATVCLDLNGVVSYSNEYLLQLTGRKRHEVVGKNWFELFVPESEPVRQIFRQMLDKGEIVNYHQHEILTSDGGRLMIAWNNTINRDSNGVISGTTSIGTDITQKYAAEQALEQSHRILRSLVDAAPASLFLIDREGSIQTANNAFARHLNKGIRQVPGCKLGELFSPEVTKDRWAKIEQVFTSGQSMVFEDTRDLWKYEHHLNPAHRIDGTVEYVSVLSIDITDKRRNEEEQQKTHQQLLGSNQELEQRLKQRTEELRLLQQELAKARDLATGASRSKSEFLANMSHEIRTPMNAIMGLVHLALQTDLTHKQREYLETVSNSAQSLLGIINDILDVSRIESGRLEMQTISFSLEGVLARSATLLSIKAREKGINLEQQIDPEVPDSLIGDPLRMEQILVNLLGNALKFTDHGTIILTITKGRSQTPTDRVTLEISISDTGIGMDEATIARLFRPFSQGDSSSTRTHGGTGLGLTICRHLVEMMGGSISVESSPGKGSCFRFTLVLGVGIPATIRTGKKAERGALVQRYQSLQGLHLLVAEDHPINRQIIKEVLEAVHIQVETANNGREAVAFMQDHGDSIDLILMDLQMPVMDGYEATLEIRRRFSRNRLPIIAMTAHALSEERERCLASGMNEHLPKPVIVEKLYELLARLTDRPPQLAPVQELSIDELFDSGSEPFPQQLPGITIDTALTRVNGNKRLLGELIRLFVREHHKATEELGHLIAEQDLASAARLIHGLKGVAGNLSADRLYIASANLETALKNQDATAAHALLPLFDAALHEICDSAELLTEPVRTKSCTVSGSPAEIQTLLSELQLLFELHSLEVTLPINRLRGLIPPGNERTQLEAMADAAQRLDYQQALMILHTLAEKTGTSEEIL
jgi:PAS domain S-box-containing protein